MGRFLQVLCLVPLFVATSPAAWAEPPVRVRYVYLDNQNVFDTSDPEESGAFYRVINALHIKTRQSVFLQQLLFAPGDVYDAGLVEESARLLRNNAYLRDAEISVVINDGYADVFIVTEDTWSTKPTLAYDKKGDSVKTKIGIEEDNLLGLGMKATVEYIDTPERNGIRTRFANNNIGGSRYQLELAYALNSDGDEKLLRLEKPFYSFISTHANGLRYAEVAETDALYDRSGRVFEFELFERDADLYKGWSEGLQNNHVVRHQLGLHFNRRDFASTETADFSVDSTAATLIDHSSGDVFHLPGDAAEYYPYYQVSFVEDKFVKTTNFEKIGRTEDRNLGISASLLLGYASEGLGSEGNRTKLQTSLGATHVFNSTHSADFSYHLNFDLQDAKVTNVDENLLLRYFYQPSPQWQTYLDYDYRRLEHPDYRQQLFLGGATGLRGYAEHFVGGDEIHKLTLEQRYFSNIQLWQIWNLGAAVFFDMGYASGDRDLDRVPAQIYSDVGIGLRIANNRSSAGNIIHLDLALPLKTVDGQDTWQFSATAKKTF